MLRTIAKTGADWPPIIRSCSAACCCTATQSACGVRERSRKQRTTTLRFRYLSADQHPDHDTIANFRQQHLKALAELLVQALRLCRQAGLVKLGTLAIDGTKVKAQASERRSMRLQQIRQEEQRLHALTEQLLQQAAQTDADEDAQWGKGQRAEALPLELADAKNGCKDSAKRSRSSKKRPKNS
jgi:hypothetical protein